MNKSNTHCWTIILKFCRLEERIQCSHINKTINQKFMLIQPSVNDLLIEIEYIFIPECKSLIIPKKSNDPYLNLKIHLNEYRIYIGLDAEPDYTTLTQACRMLYENIEVLDFDNDSNEILMKNIIYTCEEWKSIFIRECEEDTWRYITNISPKSKYYSKVCFFRDDGCEVTMVCDIRSFSNNFPILFAKRSRKLFLDDHYESWKDHIGNVVKDIK